MDWEIVYKFYS